MSQLIQAMFCSTGLGALPFPHDRFRLPKPKHGVPTMIEVRMKSVSYERRPLPPPLVAAYKAPLKPVVVHYANRLKFSDEDYTGNFYDQGLSQV